MEENGKDDECQRPRDVNVVEFVKGRVRQIAELIQVGSAVCSHFILRRSSSLIAFSIVPSPEDILGTLLAQD